MRAANTCRCHEESRNQPLWQLKSTIFMSCKQAGEVVDGYRCVVDRWRVLAGDATSQLDNRLQNVVGNARESHLPAYGDIV